MSWIHARQAREDGEVRSGGGMPCMSCKTPRNRELNPKQEHPHLAPLYILTTPIPATSTYVLTADLNSLCASCHACARLLTGGEIIGSSPPLFSFRFLQSPDFCNYPGLPI